MIKIFTTNKDGKISMTAKELKELLDEAYWDGYKASPSTFTYTSPNPVWSSPFTITTTGLNATISSSDNTCTCELNNKANTVSSAAKLL